MSSKADVVSAEGMRRFALVATVAIALWAVMIATGLALL
jgi:hypothetical protein